MKIAFVSYKYHWKSYSIVRSFWEILQQKNPDTIWYNKFEDIKENVDYIFLFGSKIKITKEQFERRKCPIFCFGLSDPTMFSEERYNNCDIYLDDVYKTSEPCDDSTSTADRVYINGYRTGSTTGMDLDLDYVRIGDGTKIMELYSNEFSTNPIIYNPRLIIFEEDVSSTVELNNDCVSSDPKYLP